MKISMVRFKFILGVILLILFLLLHPAGNLYAREPITLLEAYEGVEYSYQFKTSKCYLNPVWEEIDKLPAGLSLNKSGLLFGKPETGEEKEFYFKVKLKVEACDPCKNGLESKEFIYIVTLKVKKFPRWNVHENYRTIFGFEYSGASSAANQQKLFFDIYLSNPFPIKLGKSKKKGKSIKKPVPGWGTL